MNTQSKGLSARPQPESLTEGIGAPSPEYRQPCFAEIEAEMKDQEAAWQQGAAVKQRRQRGPGLPAVLRKEITRCAQQLRQHRKLFMADPTLKDRVGRFLRSLLPPKRKRGRPGIPSVTKAILLLKKLQHEHPEMEQKQLWPLVYPQVIPNYVSQLRQQQRAQELLLREQVRSRRNQRRRRNGKRAIESVAHTGSATTSSTK